MMAVIEGYRLMISHISSKARASSSTCVRLAVSFEFNDARRDAKRPKRERSLKFSKPFNS